MMMYVYGTTGQSLKFNVSSTPNLTDATSTQLTGDETRILDLRLHDVCKMSTVNFKTGDHIEVLAIGAETQTDSDCE